jgi:hypothetical protein
VVVTLSLAAMSALSLAGTKDYLSWNRVRWAALEELMAEQSVPPTQIDGGFEFNGWYLYDDSFQPTHSRSHYWVYDDSYVVAMGEIGGYDTMRSYGFSRWIPPNTGHILVLRRRQYP